MKHFLNGVAIVAVLAIAVPAIAQAQSPGARPARPKPPAMGHASGRHHTPMARAPGAAPGDNVADQLNQQELQRLGAGPAPAAMTAPAPGGMPGPRVRGGGTIRPGSSPGPASMRPGAAEEGPRVSGGGNIPAPTGPMPMPPPPPISSPVR